MEHLGRQGFAQQQSQIQVLAGLGPVGFLGKGHGNVMHRFSTVAVHHHHGQHKLVFLIQPVADFVGGDGDGVLPLGAAFDFDVAL